MKNETKDLIITIILSISLLMCVVKLVTMDEKHKTVILFQNDNGQVDTLRFKSDTVRADRFNIWEE